jgi:hypothetical protein
MHHNVHASWLGRILIRLQLLGNTYRPPEHRNDGAPLAPGIALAVGYIPNSGGDGWPLAAKEEGNRCCCVSSYRFDSPRIEPGSVGGTEGGFTQPGCPIETGRLSCLEQQLD